MLRCMCACAGDCVWGVCGVGAVIPTFLAFIITTVESVGDITGSTCARSLDAQHCPPLHPLPLSDGAGTRHKRRGQVSDLTSTFCTST